MTSQRTAMWARLLVLVFAALSLCERGVQGERARSPVLMWGATEAQSLPALDTMSEDDFSKLVREQMDPRTFTVVFIEETLSAEDFSLKDDEGRNAYTELKRKKPVYLSSVEEPVNALERIAEGMDTDRVQMGEHGLSAEVGDGVSAGRLLWVSLQDAQEDEDRLKMLSRHDRFMDEMYQRLSERHKSVLAIYTSRFPSWEVLPDEVEVGRVRRQLLDTEAELPENLYKLNNTLLGYFPNILLYLNGNENGTQLVNGTGKLLESSDKFVSFQIDYGKGSLTFNLTTAGGYWDISKLVYDSSESSAVELKGKSIETANGFSYHCGSGIIYEFKSNATNVKVDFGDFQIQPFFNEPGNGRFDAHYDCVAVMTIPIWSGIILIAILLLIMSSGIMMMLDIRTMDRFDDPKGKTITIAASE